MIVRRTLSPATMIQLTPTQENQISRWFSAGYLLHLTCDWRKHSSKKVQFSPRTANTQCESMSCRQCGETNCGIRVGWRFSLGKVFLLLLDWREPKIGTSKKGTIGTTRTSSVTNEYAICSSIIRRNISRIIIKHNLLWAILKKKGIEESWEALRLAQAEKGRVTAKVKGKACRMSREEACASSDDMWKAVTQAKTRVPRQPCLPNIQKSDGNLAVRNVSSTSIET